ncbi:MAG: hypothetical protein ACM3H8_14155 [Sphingobacteriales bacterium]
MKLKLLVAATAICLTSQQSFSQEISFRSAKEKNVNKQSLFVNIAERTTADFNLMQNLFNLKTGQGTTIKLSDNLQLMGHVVMTEQQSSMQSVTLRCTNFPNTLFTLSKVTLEDGSVTYTGAILNHQSKDVITLEKDDNGIYAWTKKNLSDLIQD